MRKTIRKLKSHHRPRMLLARALYSTVFTSLSPFPSLSHTLAHTNMASVGYYR